MPKVATGMLSTHVEGTGRAVPMQILRVILVVCERDPVHRPMPDAMDNGEQGQVHFHRRTRGARNGLACQGAAIAFRSYARHAACLVRRPRLDLLGMAQRVVQRGNSRLAFFLDH
jgi:hypothetical protein